jgi:glycosyltransferase involved in cell wall biosynthesis
MQDRVSVIIPCWNAKAWIHETLWSVASQRCDDMEVIVVDDGSTDDTAAIVESDFPAVRLVRTPNSGASHARNTGTESATGEFIQYLDADDLLTEGKIRAQIEALERTGADVAYGDWQKLVRSGEGFAPGEIVSRVMGKEPELDLFGAFWCPPAAYLFRRSIVDKVGAWNERLPVIQDARFALDCALHGGRFVHCAGIMAHYRVHDTGSLSRRSPEAFHRDVHRNAQEIESWWREHGGIGEVRRRALISCMGYVARSSYERDPATFEAAVTDLERLCPGYAPDGPLHLKLVSKLMGYRRAERAAACYRRAKRSLSGGSK